MTERETSGLGAERRLPSMCAVQESAWKKYIKKAKNMFSILFYMRPLWKWNRWQEEPDAGGLGLAASYLKLSVVIQIDER